MARSFEYDRPPETSSSWVALLYGLLIIGAGVAVGLVVYYAL